MDNVNRTAQETILKECGDLDSSDEGFGVEVANVALAGGEGEPLAAIWKPNAVPGAGENAMETDSHRLRMVQARHAAKSCIQTALWSFQKV